MTALLALNAGAAMRRFEMQDTFDQTLSRGDTLAQDETFDLISSNKVDGTAVYNPEDERLGKIDHFMVGKRDGRVRYAVLDYGGFFGAGDDLYPLPWEALTYSVDKGGYVVNIDKDRLDRDRAPSFRRGEEPTWDTDYDTRIRDYYR
jgi:hypothetical protein